MTPKEKAQELFWKYTKVSNFSAVLDFDGNTHIDLEFGISKVKQCALIAVEECIKHEQKILTQIQSLNFPNSFIITLNDGVFWEEVKHEINNL